EIPPIDMVDMDSKTQDNLKFYFHGKIPYEVFDLSFPDDIMDFLCEVEEEAEKEDESEGQESEKESDEGEEEGSVEGEDEDESCKVLKDDGETYKFLEDGYGREESVKEKEKTVAKNLEKKDDTVQVGFGILALKKNHKTQGESNNLIHVTASMQREKRNENKSHCSRPNRKLFEASLTGDVGGLLHLLKEQPLLLYGVALASVQNPLHVAAMAGHFSFVKEMI
ncbi:hypothetical protein IFM89_026297, partial [Coptis chinensis]